MSEVQAAIAQAPSVVYVPNIDTYRSSDPDYPNMDPELILDLIPPEFSVRSTAARKEKQKLELVNPPQLDEICRFLRSTL